MTEERAVKAALQLGPRDRVEELGVFPQPASLRAAKAPWGDETWESAQRATESDLIALGDERSSSVEPRIQASLPRGRAKRIDDAPGVIVLEDIPAPKLVLGPVTRGMGGAWIVDVRGGPAVLLMNTDGRELALWGEGGSVRLFSIERLV